MPRAIHSPHPASSALRLSKGIPPAALILLLATLTAADARVFRQWGSTSDSHAALLAAGGAKAYESVVAINSGKALLTVFSFQLEAQSLARELQRLFDTGTSNATDAATGMLLTRGNGRVLRFIIVPLEQRRQTVVFKLDQSEEEYEESKRPPEKHPLKDVPGYPQSTPTFFARNEDTGLSAAMALTSSPPEAVQAFYRTRLRGDRWTPLFPLQSPGSPDDTPATASLAIYSRGEDVCYIYAQPSATRAETRITLLHKQRVLK